ncbi:MAG: insulinase family protein [Myxococcota bacterium]|nr:insulinase family protein [Myxococcota bacterium]
MMLPAVSVQQGSLPNGLRVVTVELPHLHGVTVCAYVRVGSRFETASDSGLSHFLEHMLFRGTARLPSAFELNRAVEDLGGTLYAETRRDSSLYQIALPQETAHQGLQLLGEILTQPAFTQIEVERRIILEEMQEDLDERGEDINLSDLICAALWPGHPLGQKITGPVANVRRFDEADLRRHFATHYGASNMVLCVSGGVRHDEVMAWAQEALAALPRGQIHPVVAPPPLSPGPRRVHRDGETGPQTTLNVAFRCFGELDPDFPALIVLGRLLDDGMSTRLYQRVVNELGLAYYVGAGMEAMVDTGIYELEATATHASVPALVSEIFGLLRLLREQPPTPQELDKARRRYRWDLIASHDEPGTMADLFGRTALYYPPPTLQERLERVLAVTAEDVQRVAQQVLRREAMVVGTVGRLSSRLRAEVQAAIDRFD